MHSASSKPEMDRHPAGDRPKKRKRRSRRKTCPSCKKTDEIVQILYGMPTQEAFEAGERGVLHIGGCIVEPEQPTHHCIRCDVSF